MACSRDGSLKDLVNYIENLGLTVNTGTKARGNKGFLKGNRIDISKKVEKSEVTNVLMHEFAHFIHSQKDKTLKNFNVIFNSDSEIIKNELIKVTNFVDNNSQCLELLEQRDKVIREIKILENNIKLEYPDFKRGCKHKKIEQQIKKTKAKYLLKHDRVKVLCWFCYEYFSVERIEQDFPNLSLSCINYVKLRALQRKRARISSKINRLKKYYNNSGELFARFVEGLCKDNNKIKQLAPITYERFFNLLDNGYYGNLKDALDIVNIKSDCSV